MLSHFAMFSPILISFIFAFFIDITLFSFHFIFAFRYCCADFFDYMLRDAWYDALPLYWLFHAELFRLLLITMLFHWWYSLFRWYFITLSPCRFFFFFWYFRYFRCFSSLIWCIFADISHYFAFMLPFRHFDAAFSFLITLISMPLMLIVAIYFAFISLFRFSFFLLLRHFLHWLRWWCWCRCFHFLFFSCRHQLPLHNTQCFLFWCFLSFASCQLRHATLIADFRAIADFRCWCCFITLSLIFAFFLSPFYYCRHYYCHYIILIFIIIIFIFAAAIDISRAFFWLFSFFLRCHAIFIIMLIFRRFIIFASRFSLFDARGFLFAFFAFASDDDYAIIDSWLHYFLRRCRWWCRCFSFISLSFRWLSFRFSLILRRFLSPFSFLRRFHFSFCFRRRHWWLPWCWYDFAAAALPPLMMFSFRCYVMMLPLTLFSSLSRQCHVSPVMLIRRWWCFHALMLIFADCLSPFSFIFFFFFSMADAILLFHFLSPFSLSIFLLPTLMLIFSFIIFSLPFIFAAAFAATCHALIFCRWFSLLMLIFATDAAIICFSPLPFAMPSYFRRRRFLFTPFHADFRHFALPHAAADFAACRRFRLRQARRLRFSLLRYFRWFLFFADYDCR